MDLAIRNYLSSIFAKLTSCAEAGAPPYRFFSDKGIDSFAVYLADDVLARVCVFGPRTGFKVTRYFSDIDHTMTITGRKHECKAITSIKKTGKKTYCLFAGPPDKLVQQKLKQMNYVPVNLSKVLQYSLISTSIFDKLNELTRHHLGLRVLIVEPPWLNLVRNKSEWELSLVAGQPIPGIKAQIFQRLGYPDKYMKGVCFDAKQVWDSGMAALADRHGDYVNIRLGVRVTTDTPDEPDAYVYVCGHSMVYGYGVDDSNTISSTLQRKLNTLPSQKFEVVNRGNGGNPNIAGISSVLSKTKFRDKDIIIILTGSLVFTLKHYPRKFAVCRPIELFHRPHDMGEVYIDCLHFSSVGSNAVAEVVFNAMQDQGFFEPSTELPDSDSGWTPPARGERQKSSLSEEETVDLMRYTTSLQEHRLQIGSIVMNCNPFTHGHRYLIEYAAARVERLYVFVVEEDRSVFKFSDRLELVRRGTADLDNVVVIPSGRFIISQRTFEAYSNKENLQDKEIDPSMDIELFAQQIAPSLGINIRFAGEEPLDNVTRQYNATMRRLLPQYGINFEVIARKEAGGEVISASRVRKLLESRDFDEISQLVPESTLEYLRNTPSAGSVNNSLSGNMCKAPSERQDEVEE